MNYQQNAIYDMTEEDEIKTLNDLEAYKKQVESYIEMGDAVNRLRQNPDFKKVFENYLFGERAAQMVRQLGSDKFTEKDRELNFRELTAIGTVQTVLDELSNQGDRMVDSLQEVVTHITNLRDTM